MERPPERPERRRPSPPSVLIVDDNDDLREGLRTLLETEQFTVLEASNGREALGLLASCQTSTPCLILLDLQMPVMSGWEFLDVVKSYMRLATIPVIVSSGLRPDPQVLAHPSVAAWSQKSGDPSELIRLVHAHARDPEGARTSAASRMRLRAS